MAADTTEPVRLILIDDNPIIRELLRQGVQSLERQIGGRPFKVSEAADGGTAWEQIQQTVFDLVVVDIYLPVLDGIELIRRIRENERNKGTRILAMSASVEDARHRCLDAGADAFIQKPLRSQEVQRTLRSLLGLGTA